MTACLTPMYRAQASSKALTFFPIVTQPVIMESNASITSSAPNEGTWSGTRVFPGTKTLLGFSAILSRMAAAISAKLGEDFVSVRSIVLVRPSFLRCADFPLDQPGVSEELSEMHDAGRVEAALTCRHDAGLLLAFRRPPGIPQLAGKQENHFITAMGVAAAQRTLEGVQQHDQVENRHNEG